MPVIPAREVEVGGSEIKGHPGDLASWRLTWATQVEWCFFHPFLRVSEKVLLWC